MIKKLKSIGVLAFTAIVVLCSMGNNLFAAENKVLKDDTETQRVILEGLRKSRGDLQYSTPVPSVIPGLYEVQVINGPTLYASPKGDYFIAGELYTHSAEGFVSVKEQKLQKQRPLMLAQLKAEDEIIFSPKGETKAVVHVFTDVDCGYCQKLHQEIAAINAKGIEVRYLAYPRAGPNSDSAKKLATAWCAKDKKATLTRLKNREPVTISTCENNPVAAQYQLGGMMGVNGTPNMITSTGEMIGGYVPADTLAQLLGLEPAPVE